MLSRRATPDAFDEQSRRLETQDLTGLIHGSKSILGEVAVARVVVADDGEIMGYAEAELARDAQHFKGDEIGPAEYGIRPAA
jgi:hypothetical protein